MPTFLTVSEAARELDCTPKMLSDWLYLRKLDVKRCPIHAGRRMIPRDYLPTIATLIRARATLPGRTA